MCRSRAETRHLIGADALAMMRPGAILVNTSRGGVVDTAALIDALRSGRLAAAGLDVYEDEPNVPDRAARTAEYSAAAAHRLGHGHGEGRDGAAVRRERDRRDRGAGASRSGGMSIDFSADQFEALFRQVSNWGALGRAATSAARFTT